MIRGKTSLKQKPKKGTKLGKVHLRRTRSKRRRIRRRRRRRSKGEEESTNRRCQDFIKKQALNNTKWAKIPETIEPQIRKQPQAPPRAVSGSLGRLFGSSWSVLGDQGSVSEESRGRLGYLLDSLRGFLGGSWKGL